MEYSHAGCMTLPLVSAYFNESLREFHQDRLMRFMSVAIFGSARPTYQDERACCTFHRQFFSKRRILISFYKKRENFLNAHSCLSITPIQVLFGSLSTRVTRLPHDDWAKRILLLIELTIMITLYKILPKRCYRSYYYELLKADVERLEKSTTKLRYLLYQCESQAYQL